MKIGRENHNCKDRFLREKTLYTSLSEKNYSDVISNREFDWFSPSFSLEEKGYLYKSRGDVEIASISGGCNRTIFNRLPAVDVDLIW